MANRSRHHSEKSSASSSSCSVPDFTEMEYFWCIELNADKRSITWTTKDEVEDDEEDDGDEEFIERTIFVKLAVLDAKAVPGEQNIVMFESNGQDKEMQKGAIANLTRGLNPMATLNFTIHGKVGGTFTLAEGSGPVTISGNYLLEFPGDDKMVDYTQSESYTEAEDKEVDDEDESVEDEEDADKKAKDKKNSKRKAATKGGKQKQKAKVDKDDDEDDSENEEEEEDDEDYDFEKDVKTKQAKKVKDSGKKVKTTTKMDKDAGKKIMKKMKK